MADATEQTVPTGLTALMHPFRDAFTAPTWEYVLVLVMGAILVPGRRTVASALRVMGRGHVRHFSNYHRVLNRNVWSAHWLSRRLLIQLVDTFVPAGEPVVIAPADSIERRWGSKIKKRVTREVQTLVWLISSAIATASTTSLTTVMPVKTSVFLIAVQNSGSSSTRP